jgi:flagellar biosynthesis/type III secretory pathway chaperone
MMASALQLQSTELQPARLAELGDAFDTERRLLVKLAEVLHEQRHGLAANDIAALDESVYAAQRIFLTLQQARRRRRTLLQMSIGEAEVPLAGLEASFGTALPPELLESRDGLLEAARDLARHLEINREVIHGAIAVGDQLIRAMTGAPDHPAVYGAEREPGSAGSAGTIVNTTA